MIYAVPWIIAIAGLGLSWFWGDRGVPKIIGTEGQAALLVGIVFGLSALEADERIRGGYFTEYGEVDEIAPFLTKPIVLVVYCSICQSLIGVRDA